MNVKELIANYRRLSDDTVQPYFWSDQELIGYANQVERDAAGRGKLIMDVETSDVCRYRVRAGQPIIELDPRVVEVRRARLLAQDKALAIRGWREIEELTPNWDSTTGTPAVAMPDLKSACLYLSPTPTADDSLTCAIFRLPLNDMAAPDDSPEINPRYHLNLVHGMLAIGYGKHDSECFDPQAAAFYSGLFDAAFGPPVAAPSDSQAAADVSRARHGAPR